MKLLILVLGANDPISTNLIENGIKPTWGKDFSENIRIMYYYGGKTKNEIVGNDIFLTCDDSYGKVMTTKTYEAFQMVYDNIDFDIVYRTNISSYIKTHQLYSFLSKYNGGKDIFGSALPGDLNVPWIELTGIGMVLSKDVVEKILQNRNIPNINPIGEDVDIEVILKHIYKNEYNTIFKRLPRFDLLGNSFVEYFLFLHQYNHFHFRCKTISGNRNIDVEKMKQLYKIFNK